MTFYDSFLLFLHLQLCVAHFAFSSLIHLAPDTFMISAHNFFFIFMLTSRLVHCSIIHICREDARTCLWARIILKIICDVCAGLWDDFFIRYLPSFVELSINQIPNIFDQGHLEHFQMNFFPHSHLRHWAQKKDVKRSSRTFVEWVIRQCFYCTWYNRKGEKADFYVRKGLRNISRRIFDRNLKQNF